MFGDLWAFPFDVAVWGTVGQWVSSLVSAASVFLALLILMLDRREKERAQASKVVFSTKWKGQELTANVHNHSDAVLFVAVLFLIEESVSTPSHKWRQPETSMVGVEDYLAYTFSIEADDRGLILANTSLTKRWTIDEPRRPGYKMNAFLIFNDANGVTWKRSEYMGRLDKMPYSGWRHQLRLRVKKMLRQERNRSDANEAG
ncbi:hypothetical protein [Rhodococcus daqingensis]|uniref:PH domain-containing protein n=1 Tax=Rhodococcus daqingensis TaxID=2479363 RepID=A0ABW2S3C0_9NOCA